MQGIDDDLHKITTAAKTDIAALHALIDAWFIRHFHNSPISRNGEVINKLLAAKEDLKNDISKF